MWHPTGSSNVLPSQSLSSPSQSLYMDMGMVMMPKKGVPRDGAMGGSMGSTSATMPVAVAVPLGLEVLALLGTPHPLSDPQDLGERRSRTRTRRSPS
jgi:hypothetical protein